MKRIPLLVFAALTITTSQANTQLTPVSYSHKLSAGTSATATKSVAVRVLPRKQRVLQHQLHVNRFCEDNDDPAGPDELDLQSPYRRPRIVEIPRDADISDYITVRLAVARARAMAKYRENHKKFVDIAV
jgi:hypothetical protein